MDPYAARMGRGGPPALPAFPTAPALSQLVSGGWHRWRCPRRTRSGPARYLTAARPWPSATAWSSLSCSRANCCAASRQTRECLSGLTGMTLGGLTPSSSPGGPAFRPHRRGRGGEFLRPPAALLAHLLEGPVVVFQDLGHQLAEPAAGVARCPGRDRRSCRRRTKTRSA